VENNFKVDSETAENEFNRFVDMMDLDLDATFMDEEDRKGLELQKRRIVRSIQSGALVINDEGEPVFTPQRSNEIEALTFHEPTGSAFMAMDKRKKNEDVSKMYAVMAEMSKVHSNVFSKLKGSDLKVCQAVVTLFLG